jgi:hypothetical protein
MISAGWFKFLFIFCSGTKAENMFCLPRRLNSCGGAATFTPYCVTKGRFGPYVDCGESN